VPEIETSTVWRTSFVDSPPSVVDSPINKKSFNAWKASVNYKALDFVHDSRRATMKYEIKRTRAQWDPDLPPSGGFRCPVGTRYGGQITDRFGRNCGWGITRRIANTLTDLGERSEGILDERRGRRVNRRNRRMQERIARGEVVPGRRGRRGALSRLRRKPSSAAPVNPADPECVYIPPPGFIIDLYPVS
jgi:hypothetical protein